MSRFNTLENKGIVMRSLLVLALAVSLVGTVAAQDNTTAEDFTTPAPDVQFRMNPVDELTTGQNFTDYEAPASSGFTDNGNYITVDASTNGYVSTFEFPDGNANDEWTRGKVDITHEYSNMDDLQYNLVQVYATDSANQGIRQTHKLDAVSGSTNGKETLTLRWDEEDLIQDSNFDVSDTRDPEYIGIQIWPTVGGDSVDVYNVDFKKSQETYTETYYNGTASVGWNNPQTTQINGEDIEAIENQIVGSQGDYRWEVTTDSIYVAEYDISGLNPSELQYYMINASVPQGGDLYYGLVNQNDDSETPYEITEGIKVEGDTGVRPIVDGFTQDLGSQSLNTSIRPYHFQVGGLVSGNRTYAVSNYDNSSQDSWDDIKLNGRPWYWRSSLTGITIDNNMPQSISGDEFDKVVMILDSTESGSHTFQISEITYGPIASDLSPGSSINIGGGETVDSIDDRNEIVDGGLVDDAITYIANYTGLGLTATRFLLGILISLGVGLGVGWSEEYGSTALGTVGFGFTFISLMLVGLVPMVYGLIFILVAGGLGWISWKNKSQTVMVNGK